MRAPGAATQGHRRMSVRILINQSPLERRQSADAKGTMRPLTTNNSCGILAMTRRYQRQRQFVPALGRRSALVRQRHLRHNRFLRADQPLKSP